MPRKKKQEEHENHERWLVSYADFITLLFAFFVVMYSVSSVNEGKFRVLSESMEASFRSSNKSITPIQIGQVVRKPHQGTSHTAIRVMSLGLNSLPPPRFSEPVKKLEKAKARDDGKKKAARHKKKIKDISRNIKAALLPLVKKGLVKINANDKWIEVDINSSILFPSGGAHLARQAIPVLERIATIFKPLKSEIQVEGFTDNIPISNLVYPSNWELSAARSASVVHLFTKTGVNPVRMSAVGYGEFRPVASNKTAIGRQRNRRVVLKVKTSLVAEEKPKINSGSSIRPTTKAVAPKNVRPARVAKPDVASRSPGIRRRSRVETTKPARLNKPKIKPPVVRSKNRVETTNPARVNKPKIKPAIVRSTSRAESTKPARVNKPKIKPPIVRSTSRLETPKPARVNKPKTKPPVIRREKLPESSNLIQLPPLR